MTVNGREYMLLEADEHSLVLMDEFKEECPQADVSQVWLLNARCPALHDVTNAIPWPAQRRRQRCHPHGVGGSPLRRLGQRSDNGQSDVTFQGQSECGTCCGAAIHGRQRWTARPGCHEP